MANEASAGGPTSDIRARIDEIVAWINEKRAQGIGGRETSMLLDDDDKLADPTLRTLHEQPRFVDEETKREFALLDDLRDDRRAASKAAARPVELTEPEPESGTAG